MRKRILESPAREESSFNQEWLDLAGLAQAEISSEEAAHPIESALVADTGSGWRAAQPGEQTIRLQFDEPLRLRRVRLTFQEEKEPRTQQFVLRWSANGGKSYREIVRQQFNFSPPGTTREEEDYRVELDAATTLELKIIPEVGGGMARASLRLLRVA
jgi:hypothetical protein